MQTFSYRRSKSRNLASISIAISIGTLVTFVDLFAPFTAPFSIGVAVHALRNSTPDSSDRNLARRALWLAIATLVLWVLLLPAYNAMNEGL